jgi:hypothetical protein
MDGMRVQAYGMNHDMRGRSEGYGLDGVNILL